MEDNQELLYLIEQHIFALKKNPQDVASLVSLVDLYLRVDNIPKSREAVEQLFLYFDDNASIPSTDALSIVNAVIGYWKTNRYSKRGSLRLNISEDRKQVIVKLCSMMEKVIPGLNPSLKSQERLNNAYYRECMGNIPESLGILSDLIAAQTPDLDLTVVIFKAAVLLMYIGGNNVQAIEYLEFLTDEPPENEGYTRTHVLALLAALYESSGDHYAVVLEQTYAALQENYSKDLEKGKKPVTNQKKLQEQLTKKAFSRSSELWEMLSIQAVDRCDYVMANITMKKACEKCPSKGSLHHLYAELCFILGNKDECIKAAERAFQINPQSAELKNLLLAVNPEKWQEKIRSVAPVREEVVDDEIEDKFVGKRAVNGASPDKKDEHWLKKLTNTANEVIKDGLLAVANAKASAEQRAKAAAEKERRRKEKREKKEKEANEREAKIKYAQTMGLLLDGNGKPRKRDAAIDGPARPEKPANLDAAKSYLDTIRSGNENIVYLDPVLKQLAEIQEAVKRDEMVWVERKKKAKEAKEAKEAKDSPDKAKAAARAGASPGSRPGSRPGKISAKLTSASPKK